MSKKILYIHHGSIIGGAPVSLKNTVNEIRKAKPNWIISIACIYKSMMPFFEEIPQISVKEYPNSQLTIGRILIGYAKFFNLKILIYLIKEIITLPYSFYQQYKFLKKENPHILHLNSSILICTALIAKMLKIKVIIHIREVISGNEKNIKRIFTTRLISIFADEIICISQTEASRFGKKNKKKIQIVHNFINTEDLKQNTLESSEFIGKHRINKLKIKISSLGGASYRKGALELIDAMSFLPDNFQLIIVGSLYIIPNNPFNKTVRELKIFVENILVNLKLKHQYKSEYQYRVYKKFRNSTKDIIFTNQQKKIAPLLNQTDILIFAGTEPHFPRPVFEAWALQKPVIVFKMEGISTIVKHNKNAMVVENINALDLAKTIIQTANSPDLMKKLGINGYKEFKQKFDPNSNTSKIINIYNKYI